MLPQTAPAEEEVQHRTSTCAVTKMSSTIPHGLLDLPLEILTEILGELSSEALQVCLDVHPTLAGVVREVSFLNRHTRNELRLTDNDVTFEELPKSFSPRLELWYFTNAAATAFRSHRSGKSVLTVLDRSSLLFPLVCFKHSFQTWLAQAGGLDFSVHNNNSNSNKHCNNSNSAENDCISTNVCNSNNWPVSTMPQEAGVGMAALAEACNMLLDGKLSILPSYVTGMLTKLLLALPGFLERSLYSQHLNLHRGSPVTLAHTWEVFIQPQLQVTRFRSSLKPMYALEILCGETVEEGSGLCVNAILILFSPEICVIWIGTVAPFLACKHGSTRTMKIIDTKCSLNSLRREANGMASVLDRALGTESANHRWMLQKLFPGVCHMIHCKDRNDVLILLNSNIELLAQHIHSHVAEHKLNQADTLNSAVLVKLKGVLRNFGPEVPSRYADFNSSNRHLAPRSPLHHIEHNTSLRTCEMRLYLEEQIRSGLHEAFASEAQYFICNRKSHVITCDTCSGLWFPKPSTLDDCIARSSELELPVCLWPYHVIVKALEVVNGALGDCVQITQ